MQHFIAQLTFKQGGEDFWCLGLIYSGLFDKYAPVIHLQCDFLVTRSEFWGGGKQIFKQDTSSCKLLFCESSPYTIYMMTFEYSHFITSLSAESLVSPVETMGTCAPGGGTWQMAQGHGSPAQCWKPVPTWSGGVGGVFIKV